MARYRAELQGETHIALAVINEKPWTDLEEYEGLDAFKELPHRLQEAMLATLAGRRNNDRYPSVRRLAARWDCSPLQVKRLAERGFEMLRRFRD